MYTLQYFINYVSDLLNFTLCFLSYIFRNEL